MTTPPRATPRTDATTFNVYKLRAIARRLERERDEAIGLLRDLLDRVDRNGGLGEYKGGQPLVTKDARAFLASMKEQG